MQCPSGWHHRSPRSLRAKAGLSQRQRCPIVSCWESEMSISACSAKKIFFFRVTQGWVFQLSSPEVISWQGQLILLKSIAGNSSFLSSRTSNMASKPHAFFQKKGYMMSSMSVQRICEAILPRQLQQRSCFRSGAKTKASSPTRGTKRLAKLCICRDPRT